VVLRRWLQRMFLTAHLCDALHEEVHELVHEDAAAGEGVHSHLPWPRLPLLLFELNKISVRTTPPLHVLQVRHQLCTVHCSVTPSCQSVAPGIKRCERLPDAMLHQMLLV
jgi:hypothetical protein